ncbi:MAG: hypothetical protein HKM07_07595 [Chlamydiae bacterium]|jgi:hypothetical protein|nr:hypothetical protein [Chlamydiota bacterium]
MLKDHFEKLLQIFVKGREEKDLDLSALLKETSAFFEEAQKELKTASPDDQKIIFAMIDEMYEKLQSESKRISEKTGMTEEQLMAFSENPKNYSPDQWRDIQNTKKKMMQMGRVVGKILKPSTPKEGSEKPLESKKIVRKVKRSDWKRS